VIADAVAGQHEHAITEPEVFTDGHGTRLVPWSRNKALKTADLR
jgi:hypothetical protein